MGVGKNTIINTGASIVTCKGELVGPLTLHGYMDYEGADRPDAGLSPVPTYSACCPIPASAT